MSKNNHRIPKFYVCILATIAASVAVAAPAQAARSSTASQSPLAAECKKSGDYGKNGGWGRVSCPGGPYRVVVFCVENDGHIYNALGPWKYDWATSSARCHEQAGPIIVSWEYGTDVVVV